jgi:hypothetical protein
MNRPPVARTTEGDGADSLSRSQTAFLVAALVASVISFQLNATMLGPAIRDINTELGPGAFAAMSNSFYLSGAIANVVLIRWSDYIGRKRALLGIMIAGASGRCCARAPRCRSWCPGYRSIFVLILAARCGCWTFAKAVPADDPGRAASGRMDWVGAALITLAVAGIDLFLTEGGHAGWSSPVALGFIAAAIAALVAFVVVEKRVAKPLIDIDEMRSRYAWPLIVVTILCLASFTMVIGYIMPSIAEDDDGFGASAEMTALLFLTPPHWSN